MGCDIHLHLEYRRKNSDEQWRESDTVVPNWGGRDYEMFAVMAGVRGDLEQIVPDRDYPLDAANRTDKAYFSEISTEELHENCYYRERILIKKNGSRTLYMREDIGYHSANWCTTSEYEKCVNAVFKNKDGSWADYSVEWLALLGTMKGYEMSGEYECRAVYWFDN